MAQSSPFKICVICREEPVVARGRCRRCYDYLRAMGRERSPVLIERHKARMAERELLLRLASEA
jgi:hypothetical protein